MWTQGPLIWSFYINASIKEEYHSILTGKWLTCIRIGHNNNKKTKIKKKALAGKPNLDFSSGKGNVCLCWVVFPFNEFVLDFGKHSKVQHKDYKHGSIKSDRL